MMPSDAFIMHSSPEKIQTPGCLITEVCEEWARVGDRPGLPPAAGL